MEPSTSSDDGPKEFVKEAEILPFMKHGFSSLTSFQEAQKEHESLEKLKKYGLTDEEIQLHREHEAGVLHQNVKVQSDALKMRLNVIQAKLQRGQNDKASESESVISSTSTDEQAITSSKYPAGHPMNSLNSLTRELFGLPQDELIKSMSKRRKIIKRLEKRTEDVLSQDPYQLVGSSSSSQMQDQPSTSTKNPKSLWDVKEAVAKETKPTSTEKKDLPIGPKPQTLYTIKDKKIVRLEPDGNEELRAVDIVVPVNRAEERLLEGTKMSLDDIKKIERFKNYEPGDPSNVLYLKNISPAVTLDQLSILFNQFILSNGGPIDVRLLTGRMRGQAFVAFQNENTAITALDEINGTILMGRPIIAEFGRNGNRIQDDLE